MTQAEKLLARILSLSKEPDLYQITVYVNPNGEIVFWKVNKTDGKLEGEEQKRLVN